MPSWRSDVVRSTCGSCSGALDVQLWRVIDLTTDPGLILSMLDGSGRVVRCARCGTAVRSTDALMFYRRNHISKTVLFLVTDAETDEQAIADGEPLARWITAQEGIADADTIVFPIDWEHIAAVVDRDVQHDMETPDADLALPASFGSYAATYRQGLHVLRSEVGLDWVTDLGDLDLPDISYSEHVTAKQCPHCKKLPTWDVRMIVTEYPGLSNQLRAGELRSFVCNHCGERLAYTSFLIIWRPRRSPHIFLCNTLPDGLVDKTAHDLTDVMTKRLGDRFRPEWISEMRVFASHDTLADALDQ